MVARVCIAFALSLLLLPSAFAKTEDIQARIEKKEQKAIDKDGSTAGMTDAAEQAYKDWDKELNRFYNALMSQLEAPEAAALKASQIQWLKFRDAEFKQIDKLYGTMDGTMYYPMRVESRVRIVRDRANELITYYHLLNEDDDPPKK